MLFQFGERRLVGLGRVELPTRGLGNRCSNQLSYGPRGCNFLILYYLREFRRTFGCPKMVHCSKTVVVCSSLIEVNFTFSGTALIRHYTRG
jgi:hypothetical protein